MSNISNLRYEIEKLEANLQKLRFTPLQSRKKDYVTEIRKCKKSISFLKRQIANWIFQKKIETLREVI